MNRESISGAEPVFKTEGGILLKLGAPDMTIEFDDPVVPQLRQKAIQAVAEQTFQLNGVKRYWAGCDGTRCVVSGWGEQLRPIGVAG